MTAVLLIRRVERVREQTFKQGRPREITVEIFRVVRTSRRRALVLIHPIPRNPAASRPRLSIGRRLSLAA